MRQQQRRRGDAAVGNWGRQQHEWRSNRRRRAGMRAVLLGVCEKLWNLTACMRALTLQLSAVTRPSVASDPKNPEKPCKLIHFLNNLPLSERLCRELLARYRALPVRSSSS